MLNKVHYQFIFSIFSLLMIFLGFSVVISSHIWFTTWMGMELMNFFVIPSLYGNNSSFMNKLSSWKYFVVQSISSTMFLISIQVVNLSNLSPSFSFEILFSLSITLSMFLKLGVPPFHMWVFEISEGLSWFKFFLINVIQKSSPLFILWNFSYNFKEMIFYYSSISCFFTLLCMFDFSLRHILIYSSILNVIWMCLASVLSLSSLTMYFVVYTLIMFSLMLFISKSSIPNLSSMNSLMMGFGFFERMVFTLSILSLSGLPPLMGFITKFDTCLSLMEMTSIIYCIPLMFCSIILVSIYINLLICSLFVKKFHCFEFKSSLTFSISNLILILMNLFFFCFYFF